MKTTATPAFRIVMRTRLRWRQSPQSHSLQFPPPRTTIVPLTPCIRGLILCTNVLAVFRARWEPWSLPPKGVLAMDYFTFPWARTERVQGARISTTAYLLRLTFTRPMMQHPTITQKSLAAIPRHCIPCIRALCPPSPVRPHLTFPRPHMPPQPPFTITRKMSQLPSPLHLQRGLSSTPNPFGWSSTFASISDSRCTTKESSYTSHMPILLQLSTPSSVPSAASSFYRLEYLHLLNSQLRTTWRWPPSASCIPSTLLSAIYPSKWLRFRWALSVKLIPDNRSYRSCSSIKSFVQRPPYSLSSSRWPYSVLAVVDKRLLPSYLW